MPKKAKVALADYLTSPEAAPTAVIVAAEEPIPAAPAAVEEIISENVVPAPIPDVVPFPDVEMKDLMGYVKRIGMCAKDLHYRAKGKPFYALHELADLAWKVEDDTDKIAEIYFMGDRGIEPPRMTEVFQNAVNIAVIYPRDDNYFLGGLMDICRLTMHSIEAIKKNYEVKSGVAAVLDQISEHCLLTIGLLDQTMKGK